MRYVIGLCLLLGCAAEVDIEEKFLCCIQADGDGFVGKGDCGEERPKEWDCVCSKHELILDEDGCAKAP